MSKIGIIGGGNMGEALIKGLQKTHQIFVCEAHKPRVQYLKRKYQLSIVTVEDLAQYADIIIFAVKPQDIGTALEPIVNSTQKNPLYISIAAGLTTKFFEKHLGQKARVIRSMPNMPALIGEGITGICAGAHANAQDIKLAQKILGVMGETVIVKEAMIDAVTAVSGSGPAYVFLFVEQWIIAAQKLGFDKIQAKQLVYKTLIGSAHLLEKSSDDATTLRTKVTSKGGTTQAAMDVFTAGKFDLLMKNALKSAKQRAKELAR